MSRSTVAASHPLDSLVTGVRARSNDAFKAVYDQMADDLTSFAYGMLADRRTAEDVVQQAFVELVKAAPRFKGDGKALRAWLFKSVRFGCLDEYRRRSRRPEIPHDSVPDVGVASDLLADQLDPRLETALAELNSRQRSAVLLRHVVGLSGEEVAQVLGVSRKAAYATIARAERRLRATLGGES
ncbi:MAG: sigma-70 family RNA polymerase sigma factor [Acidimicrobiia bacterium]|nr:sigma-70 family RNA polymerase sigma factor [Acidimicrobiia bacterium]